MKKIWIFLISLAISGNIFSFKLSPMTQTLVPANGEKHLIYKVHNQSDQTIAIELTLAVRKMNRWGKEEHPPVGDDFIIFPDQLIIKPKGKRSIKVSYLGKTKIKEEKAYRLIAEQLPVDLVADKKKRTNIKILLKYIAAFYISPEKKTKKLSLVESNIPVKEGTIEIKLRNKGNIHQILNKNYLQLSSKDKKVVLKKDELKGMFGENLLAGLERSFKIKIPKVFSKEKNLKVELVKVSL